MTFNDLTGSQHPAYCGRMDNEELLNAALAAPPSYLARKPVAFPADHTLLPVPKDQPIDLMPVPVIQPQREPEPEEVDRDGKRITLLRNNADVYERERLPLGYKARSVVDMSFDPRLAYEIALEIDDPVTVFERYGYVGSDAVALLKEPAFALTVKNYRSEITTSGLSFKLKARVQAEDLLMHSYNIATDPEAPASVRADIIKWTAKMAGYEPKEAGGEKGGGAGFNLNITFTDGVKKEVTVFENGGA